jgi:hypothetical protein
MMTFIETYSLEIVLVAVAIGALIQWWRERRKNRQWQADRREMIEREQRAAGMRARN